MEGAAANLSAFRHYWHAYGGFKAIVSSRYIWIAVALTGGLWKLWWKKPSSNLIPQIIFDVVPSLLGLSIGAMAIFSAFSESKFLSIVTQRGNNKSLYICISAMLVHFICLQVTTIVLGFFAKAYGGKILYGASTFFLCYAVLTGIAVAFALFGAAQLYNHTHRPDVRTTKDWDT